MPAGSSNGGFVSGIGMAHNPHTGIGGQYPLQAARGGWGAVCHDDLPGMLAETDANPTAMVE
jgi:hypothetical protein